MARNPILDVPLTQVMRDRIALPLQAMRLFTVGGFLRAWSNPLNHELIERVFDTPEQAHHAAAVCAGWLGARSRFTPITADGTALCAWWREDPFLPAA